MVRRTLPLLVLAAILFAPGSAHGQLTPYNPYADTQEAPAPLAPDGTIQWGVFFKSAALQKSYQRLWNLGACRGTNRAITEPVNRNKVIIDRLPEADYEGVIVGASGTLAGGLIAFTEHAAAGGGEPLVVQLHPAGVTRLRITGRMPAAVLQTGMVVRLVTEVDDRVRSSEPISAFDIVTPSGDYKPDPVRPDSRGMIVGTVKQIHNDVLTLTVPAGKLRRITLTLAPDAVATITAARLDLAAAGDTISVTGRLGGGEGAMGAGIIFASDVTLTKPALHGEVALPAVDAVAGRP